MTKAEQVILDKLVHINTLKSLVQLFDKAEEVILSTSDQHTLEHMMDVKTQLTNQMKSIITEL